MGDRFPNFLRGELTVTAADAFTNLVVRTPRARRERTGMEILWIDFEWDNGVLNAAGEELLMQITSGAAVAAELRISDARVIAKVKVEMELLTSGAIQFKNPRRVNMTSADGFGTLFVGDAFNFSVDSANTAVAVTGAFSMAYRFVPLNRDELLDLTTDLLRT